MSHPLKKDAIGEKKEKKKFPGLPHLLGVGWWGGGCPLTKNR